MPNAFDKMEDITHPISAEVLRSMLTYNPDTGVFHWLKSFNQMAQVGNVAGSKNQVDGYLSIKIGGRNYKMHRLAWLYVHGEQPAGILDHKDQDKENNRIDNLRPATWSQNNVNKMGRDGVPRGVRSLKSKFSAQIGVNHKCIWLGTFDTKQEAAHAYNKAAIEHFGEFAVLNPIGEDYDR
jgi:hypothetical protein